MVVTRQQSRLQWINYDCNGEAAAPGKFAGDVAIDDVNSICHERSAGDHDDSQGTTRNGFPRNLSKDSIPVSFLTETSIHGVKYIAQQQRHWSERLFWMIAFTLGVLSSGYLIHGVWDRYNKTPVIVRFDEHEQSLSSIPFPAVSICNNNMMSKHFVNKIISKMEINGNKSEDLLLVERRMCKAQKSLLQEYVTQGSAQDTLEMDIDMEMEHILNEDVNQLMLKLIVEGSVPCSHIIRYCKIGGTKKACEGLFRATITAHGKCCTFNMLPLPLLFKNGNKDLASLLDEEEWSKWNYEIHDVELPSNTSRPWSQKMAGLRYGLSLVLEANLGDHYCDVSDSVGFRFTLHSPLEMPRVTQLASAVPLGKEVLVDVSADITRADDEIRAFAKEKRKCIFGQERQLKLYRPYTRANCIDECIALEAAKKCNCNVLYIPESVMNTSLRYCLAFRHTATCAKRVQVDLQLHLKKLCPGCDPLCEHITYTHVTTMANLKPVEQLWENSSTRSNMINHTLTVMHIYFGSEGSVPKVRQALYGFADLIANTGGILGLCLGVSVLSGIELVYFFTLRAFCQQRAVTQNGIGVVTVEGPQRKSKLIEVRSTVPSFE